MCGKQSILDDCSLTHVACGLLFECNAHDIFCNECKNCDSYRACRAGEDEVNSSELFSE